MTPKCPERERATRPQRDSNPRSSGAHVVTIAGVFAPAEHPNSPKYRTATVNEGARCVCGHGLTDHAGGFWVCKVEGCSCPAFHLARAAAPSLPGWFRAGALIALAVVAPDLTLLALDRIRAHRLAGVRRTLDLAAKYPHAVEVRS